MMNNVHITYSFGLLENKDTEEQHNIAKAILVPGFTVCPVKIKN
jgi:hypothetical protein